MIQTIYALQVASVYVHDVMVDESAIVLSRSSFVAHRTHNMLKKLMVGLAMPFIVVDLSCVMLHLACVCMYVAGSCTFAVE
jgi:hypothetical protein